MKTKFVYVLTCSKDDHYIEQALMSIYSARHWNPDANITLITDNLTERNIVENRDRILSLVNETIVIPFEDENASMRYRSRWLKTNVRRLISGDYLFIDCDTIIQKTLSAVDLFSFSVGAVPESLLTVEEFCESLYDYTKEKNASINVDLDQEKLYFNSGVMYVKDNADTHRLYQLWHSYWLESIALGMYIDQPALAKANREMGRIIKRIPDLYNCMLWTRAAITDEAIILHISSYRNPSLLFSEKVLRFTQSDGVNNAWLKSAILNPCSSFLPFDFSILHSTQRQRKKWIFEVSSFLKGYGKYIDSSFSDFPMNSRFRPIVLWFLQHKLIQTGISLWMAWKSVHLHLKGETASDNICRK